MSIREKVDFATKEAKDSLRRAVKTANALIFNERKAQLKKDAEDVKMLFRDKRYGVMQQFLGDYKKRLTERLKELSVSKDLNIQEIARTGAKIELLANITNYPETILKEYEKLKEGEDD